MNQSKLEVNPCSWRKAREIVGKPVTIGFRLTSDLIKKVAHFFLSQSFCAVKQN